MTLRGRFTSLIKFASADVFFFFCCCFSFLLHHTHNMPECMLPAHTLFCWRPAAVVIRHSMAFGVCADDFFCCCFCFYSLKILLFMKCYPCLFSVGLVYLSPPSWPTCNWRLCVFGWFLWVSVCVGVRIAAIFATRANCIPTGALGGGGALWWQFLGSTRNHGELCGCGCGGADMVKFIDDFMVSQMNLIWSPWLLGLRAWLRGAWVRIPAPIMENQIIDRLVGHTHTHSPTFLDTKLFQTNSPETGDGGPGNYFKLWWPTPHAHTTRGERWKKDIKKV